MNRFSPRRARYALVAAIVSLPVLVLGPEAAAETQPTPPNVPLGPEITPDQFLKRAAHLAADAMTGRESGSAGGKTTEEYVASEFERMGLAPLGDGETFFQDVKLPARSPDPVGTWAERIDAGTAQRLGEPKDVLPFAFSSTTTAQGNVVFCGYGLRAEDQGYDDYAGVDVRGKVVLILRHGPREQDEESPWFLGTRRRQRNHPALSFNAKAKVAAEAGAAALLMVNDFRHDRDGLPVGVRGEAVPIPVLAISRAVAAQLMAPSGKTLKGLQDEIDEELAPRSMELPGGAVRVRAALGGVEARNVLAVRRGTDPTLRGQAVIVCAHMDHVGLGWSGGAGGQGGVVHNGADDNASGTAALLEVAESIVAGPPTRRSIVFAGWCGEEKGLVGSRSYTQKPIWPLEDTAVCVNLDMVGRYRDGADDVGVQLGGAEAVPELRTPIERLAKAEGVKLTHTWESWERSDQASFYAKKVPAVFFSTALHPDYHKPGDDWWKLNAEGAARIARVVAGTAVSLANADGRPKFTPRPPRPVFGALLADAPDGAGVLLSQVPKRFGAAKAGLEAGDVIVRFQGKPVTQAKELWPLIGTTKPGDKVEVVFMRDEMERTVYVEMSGR